MNIKALFSGCMYICRSVCIKTVISELMLMILNAVCINISWNSITFHTCIYIWIQIMFSAISTSLLQVSLAVILKHLLLLELHQKQFLFLWKCLSQCKGCGQSCEYAYLHLHSPPPAYSCKTSLSFFLDETHTFSDAFSCVQQPLGVFMNTANPENLYWAISGRWKKNS